MNETEEEEEYLSDKIISEDIHQLQKRAKMKKFLLIFFLCFGISTLITYFILLFKFYVKKNNDNDEEYDPIPKDEDLEFNEEEHKKFSRKVATESMVLAKNNGLPIENTDQVVLFGNGTINTIYGEENIYSNATKITPVTILEGFENKIKSNKNKFIYIRNEIGYEIGKSKFIRNKELNENDIKSVKGDKAKRTVAIMTISRLPVEYNDIPQDKSIYGNQLTDTEIETYNLLNKYFDHIVIVLNVGSFFELNNLANHNKTSILIVFYPGMEAGNAIADILLGDANPSGHLSFTWAKTINDYPTTKTFLESQKYVRYKEGLFVGYRYFEEDKLKQSKIVFPFGHGLSYTKFKTENEVIFDSKKLIFYINSKVTNIGKRPGKHVVQIYVKKPQNENFIKVQRELISFIKTKELKEGDSQLLNISFDLNDLASYDDNGVTGNRGCYVLEKGNYEIYYGDSVADTRNQQNLLYIYKHKELTIVKELHNRLVPQDYDIIDANKKPKFENFTDITNVSSIISNQKIIKKELYINNNNEIDEKNIYSECPINIFNQINFKSVLQKKYKLENLINTMTNNELIFLTYGKKSNIRGGKGIIGGFFNSDITGKYNIPFGDILEGSGGLSHLEINKSSTSWPCATALASSFNTELIENIGEKIGKEARKIGCFFWLSPGLSIHRSPLCGKNYENYSEDPVLSGKMGAAITRGIQSKRVSIILKSLAFNNKIQNSNGEYNSNNLAIDSRMSERVAREIYLKAFEIAIIEGNPWTIMASNNRINNMKISESYELMTSILREEWKYEGVVLSGWYSNSELDREAHAGVSVKMSNNNLEGSNTILNGLIKGTVTRQNLKNNAFYLLNTLAKTACIDSLFIKPKNILIIKEFYMKIKIFEYIYRKSNGISYDECNDVDGSYYPINTITNSWISLYINNEKDQFRRIAIRYSSALDGFGINFSKYGETLAEITNLDSTGGFEKWKTTNAISIKLPKEEYELTLKILGYDYSSSEYYDKGRINFFELL